MKSFNEFREKLLDEDVSVKKQNYSWGKMVTVHHGADTSYPLHPEHQKAIKALRPSGEHSKTSFKDETGRQVHATREGDKVHLMSKETNYKPTTVDYKHFDEEVEHLDEKLDKKQALRDALGRHEQHALDANKRGDDEAVKVHQGFINKIKTQLAKMVQNEDVETVAEARKLIGTYNHGEHTAKVYKLSGAHDEGDPYHVKLFKNGKHYEPADYFTNDHDDAHGTAKHMVKEGIEQIDELKKSTLKSYVRKASRERDDHLDTRDDYTRMKNKHQHDWSQDKLGQDRLHDVDVAIARTSKWAAQRSAGIAAANKRINKEEVDQIVEKLTDDAKKKIQAALGRNADGNTLRKTSGPARALIGLAKTNPANVKEDVELEEAIKLGSNVKMHAPGKDYHGQVGHVGEIRHGAYKGAPKTYTVDYGDGKSVQLDKKNVKLHKEEVEQVDELNKSTLGSYIKKATDDVSYHSFSAGSMSEKDPERSKVDAKAFKRQKGVEKATDRLTKEEAETSRMDQYLAAINGNASFTDLKEKTLTPAELKKREEIAQAMEREHPGMDKAKKMAIATAQAKKVAEEAEQIDEISKATLADYAKKSAVQLPGHQTNATLKATGPLDRAHSGKHPKTGETPIQWDQRKVKNRQQGIIRAVDKLTKEEDEQLDEISKETLKSYIPKAMGSKEGSDFMRGVKMGMGTDREGEEALRAKSAKRSAGIHRAIGKLAKEEVERPTHYYTSHGYTTRSGRQLITHVTRHPIEPHHQIDSHGNVTSIRKPAHEGDRGGIINHGSIHKPPDRFIKKEEYRMNLEDYNLDELVDFMVSEDFQHLDELDKKTLASYIKKATGSAIKTHASARDTSRRADDKEGDEAKALRANARSDMQHSQRRQQGIARAADRLAKEDYDLEEVSRTPEERLAVAKRNYEARLRAAQWPHERMDAKADYDHFHDAMQKEIAQRKKVKEDFQHVDEAMISYSDFKDKINMHRKMGNKIVDDKYSDKHATYTSVDKEGVGRKVTHTPSGQKLENLGRVEGDDEKAAEVKTEKRGRGRPAGAKSGARRHS